MITLTPEFVADQVAFHTGIMHASIQGVGDAAACIAPPGANSINWNIGHLIAMRDDIIEMMGGERVHPRALLARYATESAPIITPGSGETPLSDLRPLIDRQAEAYLRLLRARSAEFFAQPVTRGDGKLMTRGELFFTLAFFHESYHVFQLEQGRHAAESHRG